MEKTDRRIVIFTAGAHGLVHTYELSIPLLMTVWLTEFSTTAATLGVIVTVGYGLFGVGALPGGVLVDRFGSKPLILACLVAMAGSFVLASVAPSLASLAIAVGLWGIAASVYHPAGLALLSKAVDRPGIALGYHGIGGNVGIALGPLATALLLLRFDWRFGAAALALPAVFVVAYGLLIDVESALAGTDRVTDGGSEAAGDPSEEEDPDDTKGEISISSVLTDTLTLATVGFGLVLVIVTLNGLYYRAFLTFLPDLLGDLLGGLIDVQVLDSDSPYAEEFDLSRYLYVAILIVGVAGQYAGGRLADRIPPEHGLTYVLGTLGLLALLFVPASRSTATFVAVSLLLGVALFAVQPLSQATVAHYSPPGTRGLSFGYTFLAIFGVGALGAGLAGMVLTYATYQALFVLLAAIAVSGAIVSVVLRRIGERRS